MLAMLAARSMHGAGGARLDRHVANLSVSLRMMRMRSGTERRRGARIHRHLLVDFVEVERFAGQMLEAPDERAGRPTDVADGRGAVRRLEGEAAGVDPECSQAA